MPVLSYVPVKHRGSTSLRRSDSLILNTILHRTTFYYAINVFLQFGPLFSTPVYGHFTRVHDHKSVTVVVSKIN